MVLVICGDSLIVLNSIVIVDIIIFSKKNILILSNKLSKKNK